MHRTIENAYHEPACGFAVGKHHKRVVFNLYVELELAIQVAKKSHGSQLDKIGLPQINHPLSVMDRVKTTHDKTVAVLHDVVEDTPTTLDDLRDYGFSEDVVEAVDAISRREGERYFDYIDRVSRNETAKRVKIADLRDNMSRKHPSEREKQSLMVRYQKSLDILTKGNDDYWRYV